MTKTTINNNKNHYYTTFRTLYENSFPIYEQRTIEQEELAFNSENYSLDIYEHENKFIGFISYWEFETYIYIEHFAINDTLRGEGYGSRVLNSFIEEMTKQIILEIDPVTDEKTAARLRFYQKCGFYENQHRHTHPPYRDGYTPHLLTILTTGCIMAEKEFQKFSTDLKTIIMNF